MGDLAFNFRALFDGAEGAFLVLTPNLRIVEASDAYLAVTMRTREDLVGRHLFDAFPDPPGDKTATGVANLSASLERTITLSRPDEMAIQRYDIQLPEADSGAFIERYWKPVNTPVFASDGRLVYIVHHVEDVTALMRRHGSGATTACTCLLSNPGAGGVCRRCGGRCHGPRHQHGRYSLKDLPREIPGWPVRK